MKKTLSYLVFAIVASTSSLAFAFPVEEDLCYGSCNVDEVCEILQEECRCEDSNTPCYCSDELVDTPTCVPAPPPSCESDSDCSSDDVCVTYSYTSCSAGDVAPPCDPYDESCEPNPQPDPAPEPCVEETESLCVPQYAAPCQAAADCGAGFTCETPEICSCTNVAPAACGPEDEACDDLPREDDCSCAPSEGDAYCRLIEVQCTSDTDCQTGATCDVAGGGSRAPIACAEEGCEDLPAPPSYCIPDGYADWVTNGGTNRPNGQKAESAKRASFFGNADDSGGSATKASCSVSQGPTGFAAGALLFAMMFGFRRKKK